MIFSYEMVQAFADELYKLGACSPMTTHPQSRKGRRPMRVGTLLQRESKLTSSLEQAKKEKGSSGHTTAAVSKSQRRAKRVSR